MIVACAQVEQLNDMLARAQDGKFLFGNGRSSLTASDRIAGKLGIDEHTTLAQAKSNVSNNELASSFVEGFDFEVLHFQNELDAIAYWCAVHDEDNNQVLNSTVETTIDLCKTIAKVCGSPEDVVGYLVKVWGPSKRRQVKRWTDASVQLHEDTLAMLKARASSHGIGHGVLETTVFDNEYLVPPASKKMHALGAPWQPSAFTHLFYEIDTGGKVTKDVFEQQVCKTLKASELFVTPVERTFGRKIVESCLAWVQLKDDLRCKPSYRRAVSASLGQGLFFKDTLPEIKVIMAQLEELKGKSVPKAQPPSKAADAAAMEPSLLELNLEVARATEVKDDDYDPNMAVAKSKALFSLSKIKQVKDDTEVKSEIETLVDAGAKVLLLIIDVGACAPTPFGKHVEKLSKLAPAFRSLSIRLAAFVGPNLVLAGGAESSITSHFAQLGTYPIRLSNSRDAAGHSAGGLGKKRPDCRLLP